MGRKKIFSDGKYVDPRVKDVLKLLATGVVVASAVLMPGTAALYKVVEEYQKDKERKEWEKFNPWRLRQVIKRLEKQKVVELCNGIVQITNKGRKRVLQYDLETMTLQGKLTENGELFSMIYQT